MMRVRYSPATALDLEGIYATIAADNEPAALRVIASIRHLISLLAEHPGMGHPSEVRDAFRIVVPGLPYKIVYAADDATNELVVLRVFHAARNLRY